MLKLYAGKGAGSVAVEALLEVVGAPHEVIDVVRDANSKQPAWYFQINPRGEIPALRLSDDSVMTESAAMMIYIADCFPQAHLAPSVGTPLRAQYLRWMVYLAAAPYNSDLRMFYPERYSTEAKHADGIKAKAIIDLNRDFDLLADQMGPGPFILGDALSAVDIYAGMILSWSDDQDALFKRQPKLKTLYDSVAANPVIRKVWDRNELP